MPEDYQAILTDLGISGPEPGAPATADSTPPTDPTQEPTPASPNSGDANPAQGNGDGQPNAAPAQPQTDDSESQRRNEAFAAMRTENSKYKKFMQHIMKGANFNGSEEDFMNQLTEASYQRQAQLQGSQVSPEILKRMDSLESQNRNLIESQNRQMFATNLRNMQEQLKLNDNEIKEFIDLAVREKIDSSRY